MLDLATSIPWDTTCCCHYSKWRQIFHLHKQDLGTPCSLLWKVPGCSPRLKEPWFPSCCSPIWVNQTLFSLQTCEREAPSKTQDTKLTRTSICSFCLLDLLLGAVSTEIHLLPYPHWHCTQPLCPDSFEWTEGAQTHGQAAFPVSCRVKHSSFQTLSFSGSAKNHLCSHWWAQAQEPSQPWCCHASVRSWWEIRTWAGPLLKAVCSFLPKCSHRWNLLHKAWEIILTQHISLLWYLPPRALIV